MQFLAEVFVFLVLFVILREALVKTFPVKKIGISLSADSKKALYYYRRRYQFIFILSSIVLGAASFLLIRWVFVRLHYIGDADYVWIIEDVALLLPSLLVSFLISGVISPAINDYFQKDGLSFFFEGYNEEQLGFSKTRLNYIQQGLGVLLAILLLVAEFNVYAKLSGERLYFKSFLKEDTEVALADVKTLLDEGKNSQRLVTVSGDTIPLNMYSGDFGVVLKRL